MPSGKAKLVDMMTLYPQRDILGYGNQHGQGKVLDLGDDIDGFGHLYITSFSMGWLARQMGYISVEEHTKRVNEIQATLSEALIKVTELEAQINQLPEVAERMMERVRDIAIDAISALGGFTGDEGNDDGKADRASDRAASQSAGGDDKAPRKSRRTDV